MLPNDDSKLKVFGLTYSQHDSRQMHRILREYGKLPENPGSRPEIFVALAALAKSLDDLEVARIFSWIENGGDFPTPNTAKPSQAGDGSIEQSQGSSMSPVLAIPIRPVSLIDDNEAIAIRSLSNAQVEGALVKENKGEDDVRQPGVLYDEFGLVVETEDQYDDTDFEGSWGSVDGEEEQEEEDLIDLSSDIEDFPPLEQSSNDVGTLSTADPSTTSEQSEALQLEQVHLHDTELGRLSNLTRDIKEAVEAREVEQGEVGTLKAKKMTKLATAWEEK